MITKNKLRTIAKERGIIAAGMYVLLNEDAGQIGNIEKTQWIRWLQVENLRERFTL